MCFYLAVLEDEKKHPLDEDGKQRASQKKTAALHGCMNLILACSTEQEHAYDGFLLGFRYGFLRKNVNKMSTFYGFGTVYEVYGFIRGFEKQHETNKMPTTTQQMSTFCEHR